MEYRSQKIAYWYFAVALLLFALQVVLGLWLAFNYSFTVPQSIVDVFPFATARAMHTNLLVLWMLLGFMGGTYYIVPEETGSDIWSPKLAWFQLIVLVATGVVALAGFIAYGIADRPGLVPGMVPLTDTTGTLDARLEYQWLLSTCLFVTPCAIVTSRVGWRSQGLPEFVSPVGEPPTFAVPPIPW